MPKKKASAKKDARARFLAPKLPYRPIEPRRYRPTIGMIGCGAITPTHCIAYRAAGYSVAAFCDVTRKFAKQRQKDYYPEAKVYTDYRKVLERGDIDVVDITTHPRERAEIIEAALRAGKHVLSQKPFVLDLDVGERLVAIADEMRVKLAVNQNGRWAPHFSYMREAVNAGLVGAVSSVHSHNHWDHNWTATTPFNEIHHLILYDYAIHWFDIFCCFLGEKQPVRVFASNAHAPNQKSTPPLLAQVHFECEGAQASMVFDASTAYGHREETLVIGAEGTLTHINAGGKSQVTLYNKDGYARPRLHGIWFPDGFHGAMAELLCAIEEDREPAHSARNNLASLALCFAAVASAEEHVPVAPGEVRHMPGKA
ncbi:MAG: Gfo/Idh/MocA family protein [Candidatus Hydrogenedentota bacterium]